RSPAARRPTAGTTAAAALACALCWLAMAVAARHYFVDVPRWDIWDVVGLLERQHEGVLTAGDLLRPHNEHRPVTARLAILVNAGLFGWNHWMELALLLVAATGVPLVTTRYIALTASLRQVVSPLVLLPVAVVRFSLVQWADLLRGYHVHVGLAVVTCLAAR